MTPVSQDPGGAPNIILSDGHISNGPSKTVQILERRQHELMMDICHTKSGEDFLWAAVIALAEEIERIQKKVNGGNHEA